MENRYIFRIPFESGCDDLDRNSNSARRLSRSVTITPPSHPHLKRFGLLIRTFSVMARNEGNSSRHQTKLDKDFFITNYIEIKVS